MSSIISTISNAISGDSSSSAAPVRWGICGTGKIGHDFATAISSLKDVQIVAVGSRTQKEADDFADKFKIPRRHASYEALAKDVEVDIVYVCTPNSEHAANCILLMQHGRAVVCEKPFMVNRAEAVAVKEAAKKYNALCMEGMWTRFMPVQTKVKELLAEQKIGEVKYVSIHIGFPADSMLDTPEKNKELLDRVKKTELGGGAILDVGSYAASFAQWILGQPTQGPTKISAMGKLDPSGVDQSGTFIMQYGSDKYAQAMMSSEFNTSDNAIIMGSKGYIDIAMPWQASDKLTVYIKETDKTEEHKFKITPTPKENYPNTSLFQYEAKHMNELFRAGKKESDIMTLEESCVVMGILDEIRKQVGVKLENDNKAPPAAGPKASL